MKKRRSTKRRAPSITTPTEVGDDNLEGAPDYDARFLGKLKVAEADAAARDEATWAAVRLPFPMPNEAERVAMVERLEDVFADHMGREEPQDKVYVYDREGAARGVDFSWLFERGSPVDEWFRQMQIHCLNGHARHREVAQQWAALQLDGFLVQIAGDWNATHFRFTIEAGQGYLVLNI